MLSLSNLLFLLTGAEDAFFDMKMKHFEQAKNHSKSQFSVMFCCNAAGKMLPPMVVYKSANEVVYSSWGEGGLDGTTYAASKSGWFDMPKFNQWFKQVFMAPSQGGHKGDHS